MYALKRKEATCDYYSSKAKKFMQLKHVYSNGKLLASDTTLLTLKTRLQLCFKV